MSTLADSNVSGRQNQAGWCRNLIANIKVTSGGKIHNRCFSEIGRQFKKEAAIAWLPYHERLLSIVSEIEDERFELYRKEDMMR